MVLIPLLFCRLWHYNTTGSFAESPAVRQRGKRREREEERKKRERETPLRPSQKEELKWYLVNEGWLERIESLSGLLCLQAGILSAGFSYTTLWPSKAEVES